MSSEAEDAEKCEVSDKRPRSDSSDETGPVHKKRCKTGEKIKINLSEVLNSSEESNDMRLVLDASCDESEGDFKLIGREAKEGLCNDASSDSKRVSPSLTDEVLKKNQNGDVRSEICNAVNVPSKISGGDEKVKSSKTCVQHIVSSESSDSDDNVPLKVLVNDSVKGYNSKGNESDAVGMLKNVGAKGGNFKNRPSFKIELGSKRDVKGSGNGRVMKSQGKKSASSKGGEVKSDLRRTLNSSSDSGPDSDIDSETVSKKKKQLGSFSKKKTESGSKSDSKSKLDSFSDSGSDSDNESESKKKKMAGSRKKAVSGSESDAKTKPNSSSDSGSDSDMDSETISKKKKQLGSFSKKNTESGSESDSKTKSDSFSDSGSDSGNESESKKKKMAGSRKKAVSGSESDAKTKPNSSSDSGPDSDKNPETESREKKKASSSTREKAKSESDSTSKQESSSDTGPDSDSESQNKRTPHSYTNDRTVSKLESKPQTKLDSSSESGPNSDDSEFDSTKKMQTGSKMKKTKRRGSDEKENKMQGSKSKETHIKEKTVEDPHQNPTIKRVKKYLKAAGIRVANYAELWAGCKTDKSRAEKMKALLTEAGINGTITLKKCEQLKKKKETELEMAELSKNVIINEGGRAMRKRVFNSSPLKPSPELKKAYQRIKALGDSDSD